MMLDENIKKEIIEKINSNFEVEHIYLFGSYAHGSPDENSDIDISIVLKDNIVFKSWKEKQDYLLQVRRKLSSINNEYAIDLLVFSKNEWQKLLASDQFTYNEIFSKGAMIYG